MSDIKLPTGCQYIAVADLKPYARNPKDHTEKDVDLICRSVRRNGWCDVITVCPETMEILSGNGRLLAAKKLGLEAIPAVYAPAGLTEKQKADLVIASNKLVEVSGYNANFDSLVADFDLDLTDFGMEADVETQDDEPETEDINKKKIKLMFSYTDSREVIDTIIRDLQERHPEIMTKVEIGD